MRHFIDIVENANAFTVFEMTDNELSEKLGTRRSDFRERFRYLYLGQGETHLVAMKGKTILGILSLVRNPHHERELWIKHISVDPQFQSMGVATALCERSFQYAVQHKLLVVPSSFTEQGQRLKDMMSRFNAKYPEADAGQPFRDF